MAARKAGTAAVRRGTTPSQRALTPEQLRRIEQRMERALAAEKAAKAAEKAEKGRQVEEAPRRPPRPTAAPRGVYSLPGDGPKLWRWLEARGRQYVWAVALDTHGKPIPLWATGGWRADYVLVRALFHPGIGAGEKLQNMLGEQARGQQISPTKRRIVKVTFGVLAGRRRAA
jgi:hypothetical protein